MELAETNIVYYSKSSSFKVLLTDFDSMIDKIDTLVGMKAFVKRHAKITLALIKLEQDR